MQKEESVQNGSGILKNVLVAALTVDGSAVQKHAVDEIAHGLAADATLRERETGK